VIPGPGRRDARDAERVEARIRDVLVEMRALLPIEPRALELARFDASSGVAELRVDGDCPECALSLANLMEGIAQHLRSRIPEVRAVARADS
jgi:Fe-S cluster biogenesis protein NfuA